mgnify:CR=1 FL=1
MEKEIVPHDKETNVKIKNILLAALSACLLCTGCASGETAMSYGKTEISENVFRYWLSYYKNSFLNTYTDLKNTADSFATVLPNGETAETYLYDQTVENVKMTLICMELFRENGLTLSDALETQIDDYVDDILKEYAGGNKKTLNAALATYGVNMDMLRQIYRDQEKSGALFDYMYGENGTTPVTEEDYTAYYEENYCHVRHIYVNNQYYYMTDENGYSVFDDSGNVKTADMDAEMRAEKQIVIDAIDAALADGTDFEIVYDTYSEDKYYKNGYYLTHDIDFIPEVVDAAFSLEIGDWEKIESDYGVHYILRLPLADKAYADEDNADFFPDYETTVKSDLFVNYIRSFLPEVTVNEALIARYNMTDSPVNYRF